MYLEPSHLSVTQYSDKQRVLSLKQIHNSTWKRVITHVHILKRSQEIMVDLAIKLGNRGVIQSVCVCSFSMGCSFTSLRLQHKGLKGGSLHQWFIISFALITFQRTPTLDQGWWTTAAHVPTHPFRPSSVNCGLPLTLTPLMAGLTRH